MNSEKNALSALGMTAEEVLKVDDSLRTRPQQRDGRICICGHGASKHTIYEGIVSCKPSKMDCPCKSLRPVLEADDTRPFLRRTQGAGAMHALSRGLAALISKGKSAEWIIPLVCDKCKEPSGNLSPIPITKNFVAVDYATGIDTLLCPTCREEL